MKCLRVKATRQPAGAARRQPARAPGGGRSVLSATGDPAPRWWPREGGPCTRTRRGESRPPRGLDDEPRSASRKARSRGMAAAAGVSVARTRLGGPPGASPIRHGRPPAPTDLPRCLSGPRPGSGCRGFAVGAGLFPEASPNGLGVPSITLQAQPLTPLLTGIGVHDGIRAAVRSFTS